MNNNIKLLIDSQNLHIKMLELFDDLMNKIESNDYNGEDEATVVLTSLAFTLVSVIKVFDIEDKNDFLLRFSSFIKDIGINDVFYKSMIQ